MEVIRKNKYKIDIQILRGVCILGVLLYHSNLHLISYGYLGVDVFFVISGYLVTYQLLSKEKLSVSEYLNFIYMRAKRLLPAFYFVVAFASIASLYLLEPSQLSDYKKILIGAFTFSSNLALSKQNGYFETATLYKPLMHIWSLSLEEQFYIVISVFAFLLPRRLLFVVVLFILLGSLSLFVNNLGSIDDYYLLKYRIWELMAGSILIFIPQIHINELIRKIIIWLCFIAFFLIFASPISNPLFNRVLIVIVSLIALYFITNKACLKCTVFAYLGAISYSLYLVHWPLLSFFYNAVITPPENYYIWVFFINVISVLIAGLIYRYIEMPFHYGRPNPIFTISIFVVTPLAIYYLFNTISNINQPSINDSQLYRPNYGLSEKCEFSDAFTPISDCQSAIKYNAILWGDSFAMHLASGLDSIPNVNGFVQATKSTCPPILNISLVKNGDIKFAGDCIKFNDSVLAYIAQHPEINHVIMSSKLDYMLEGAKLYDGKSLIYPNTNDISNQIVYDNIYTTISTLKLLGKKIIFVSPPPSDGTNKAKCFQRRNLHLLTFDSTQNCEIQKEDYITHQVWTRRLVDKIYAIKDIKSINLDKYMCSQNSCITTYNGVPLYRDQYHLSYSGSKIILQDFIPFGFLPL